MYGSDPPSKGRLDSVGPAQTVTSFFLCFSFFFFFEGRKEGRKGGSSLPSIHHRLRVEENSEDVLVLVASISDAGGVDRI